MRGGVKSKMGLGLWGLVGGALLATGARADSGTPVLKDDFRTNQRTCIDDCSEGFDDLVGGPPKFSTVPLGLIEDKLRADIRRERPRNLPSVNAYFYPGRASAVDLRAMTEIPIDVELVLDPCERSSCRDAVAHYVELLGRAIGQPVLAQPAYKIGFRGLRVLTVTPMHEPDRGSYAASMSEAIDASRTPGGGNAWVEAREKADAGYEPALMSAVAKNAQAKRLTVVGQPVVHKSGNEVSVGLKIKGDRVRAEQQAFDALSAEAEALRALPGTPPQSSLEVQVDTGVRGAPVRKFRAPGPSFIKFLEGRLNRTQLILDFVTEVPQGKDVHTIDFSDG